MKVDPRVKSRLDALLDHWCDEHDRAEPEEQGAIYSAIVDLRNVIQEIDGLPDEEPVPSSPEMHVHAFPVKCVLANGSALIEGELYMAEPSFDAGMLFVSIDGDSTWTEMMRERFVLVDGRTWAEYDQWVAKQESEKPQPAQEPERQKSERQDFSVQERALVDDIPF